MELEEIILEKDRILNELYEGLIQTDNLVSAELKQLTPAQSYRQRALQMFLENDYHHMDIEEAMNRVLELNQAGNEQFIKDKLLKYHNDVYDLNLKAGREILPQSNTMQTMISEGKSISEFLDNAIFAERIDNQWNNLMMNINRQELYMGIRHVMPESTEMRMLINYGEDYINMLELLNRPSIDLENLANIQWDRVPPQPGAINNLQKQYVPPQNIEELKAMHQRFLEDFPKKAKEFILGQNIFVEENAEARLFNEEYYQYTGWGTPSPDMPVIQMNENMSIVYDKLFQREANQLFYEAAEDAGFVDQNEWFNAIVEEDKTAAFLREQGLDVPADIENQVTVKAFDAASKASKEQAEINVKKKLNSYFKKPVSSENFPDEIGFEMGKVLPENPIYNVISNPLDTPTNVVDERLRLERIIKNDIQTPELKEGLLKRYLDYDEFIEGLPADRAEQLLDYTNKDIADKLELFKDQYNLEKPYGPGELEDINSILFDWEEPSPIEDAVLADIEDWDLDSEDNPIDPRKKPEGMSKFKQELSAQYNYLLTSDTPPNTTLRVSSETGLSTHSDRIRKVAQDYHKIMGYSDPEFKPAMVFNDEVGAIAADIFEQLPMFDDNAIPYYKKFIQETNMQYQTLLDAGMKFEVVDGDPYTPNRAGHQQMIADMENGVLKVLATESGFGDEATSKLNPMLAESIYTDVNGRVMLENDVFRAVHDTFGHGMRGNTFGPIGEYNAWLAHKEMYSPDARRVMTTETLGQNTFTNYGPHMRDAEGKLLSKADAGYIKPADRPFASQKVALMPEEIINVAGTVVEDASELVDTSSLNKVVELASTQPEVADGIMKSAKKVVGKAFNTLAGVLDPGDVAITAGISRLLPRLGLAAISPAALAAYVGYELSVLAIDAAQSLDKARQKQGIELLDYDNTNPNINWKQLGQDTWNEFGEISDTWSLSWKISEPIIDYAFGEYAKLQENR